MDSRVDSRHDARMKARTVIITGASMGVGAAVAKKFHAEGAQVVLVARGKAALAETAEALAQAGGVERIMTRALDVTDTPAVERLFADVAERFGGIDVLVNNAGYHSRGPALDVPADELGRMIDVNLRAPIVMTRLVLPYLQRSDRAAVINVGSLAGRTFVPGSATYSASKCGLRAFTFSLAEELRGEGIRVGVVSPGPIDTGFIMDDIDGVTDLTFSQPISTAEEVADAVVALSDGGATDLPMPRVSGYLTTLNYLFPSFGRAIRPMLERKGRRTKARLKAQRGQ